MPMTPEARKRLADLMNNRRVELDLRWQDVAEAADLSLKTLYSARQPDGGDISDLTQGKIENGLQWQRGSIERIANGGDPVALPPRLAAVAPGQPDGRAGDAPADPAVSLMRFLVDEYGSTPDDLDSRVVRDLAAQYGHGKAAATIVAEIREWLRYIGVIGTERNGTSG
jgi:hypothetical protein